MNEGALNRDRFEIIEAYLLGTLGPQERARFEQDLQADAVLQAEVDMQRENMLAIELGGFDRLLQKMRSEAHENGFNWSRYLIPAAAAVLLLTAGLWWMNRPSDAERLFAGHFTADPGLPVTMSATEDHAFQDAMVAYKLGEYAEARTKWAPLLQQKPTNDTLRYFMASAALAMNDQVAAIPLLQGLQNDTTSVFHTKAQWYLFLAYVKVGDATNARAVRLDDQATYGERAERIKASL